MRVFVTGATGFVGTYLVNDLLADGHEVHSLFHSQTSLREPLQRENLHHVAGDLLDLDSLKMAIAAAAPDVIYHLAGQAYPGLSWQNAARTLAINTGGTANVLEAAVEFGRPRVIVVTSAEIYGKVRPNQLPISERSIPKPRHPYGISKAAASDLVRVYADRYDLPVIEARPFNHIGPGQALGFVVPDFASQVAKIKLELQEPVMRVGNLTAKRDFTDVRDVVRAYRLLAESGKPGRPYLICSSRPHPISDILNGLLAAAGLDVAIEKDPARMRPSDVPILYGSYSRIEKEVGWQPHIPFEQTLGDVLEEWLARFKER